MMFKQLRHLEELDLNRAVAASFGRSILRFCLFRDVHWKTWLISLDKIVKDCPLGQYPVEQHFETSLLALNVAYSYSSSVPCEFKF